MYLIKKLTYDTLTKEGKFSRKSLTTFTAFSFAIIYEFVLPFFEVTTKEYVFTSLLILVGATLGLTVADKFSRKEEDEEDNI